MQHVGVRNFRCTGAKAVCRGLRFREDPVAAAVREPRSMPDAHREVLDYLGGFFRGRVCGARVRSLMLTA